MLTASSVDASPAPARPASPSTTNSGSTLGSTTIVHGNFPKDRWNTLSGNIETNHNVVELKMFKRFKTIFLKRIRPWHEFFNKDMFKKPSKAELSERVEKNLRHFLGNYGVLVVILLALAIITNPFCLIIVACAGAGLYYTSLQGEIIVLPGGNHISKKNARYIVAGFSAIGLLIFAGILLIAFLAIGMCAVLTHASFHMGKVYEDLEGDDDDDNDGDVFSSPA